MNAKTAFFKRGTGFLGLSALWGAMAMSAQAQLAPVDISQMLPVAGQDVRVEFRAAAPLDAAPGYRLSDYSGRVVASGTAVAGGEGVFQVSLRTPPGFYALEFAGLHQTFGVVALPPSGSIDPFFSLDTALSWIAPVPLRSALVQNLTRFDLNLARERLSWGKINPAPDAWDWETDRRYEETRHLYSGDGRKILELFTNAPDWTGATKAHPYPDDLPGMARSWAVIGKRWHDLWGGLEVWNEVDLLDLPADQYAPVLKTMRYALRHAGVETPMGPVFAYLNKPYLALAARNGVLDNCDFVSIHYYDDPLGLERHIAEYRAWLKEFGHEGKPIWITEIGSPWEAPAGSAPTLVQQTDTALLFAGDAVEARACGIAGYFPFLYVDYNEKDTRNYGMLDAQGTPLRPMAAYAAAARLLAFTTYLGDWKTGGADLVKRARVFGTPDGNALVALYTGKVDPAAAVPFPIRVQGAWGVDGRPLSPASESIPVPDGLTYVKVAKADLKDRLLTETTDAALTASNRFGEAATLPPASPIVLQPLLEATISPSSRGYNLPEGMRTFPLRVRVNNLSGQSTEVAVRVGSNELPCITVPSQGTTILSASVDVASLPVDAQGVRQLSISAVSPGGPAISPAALALIPDMGIGERLRGAAYQFALPIAEPARWKDNASGKVGFTHGPAAAWGFEATFGSGDRWAYPQFTPPQEASLEKTDAILVRARATNGLVRLMVWDAQDKMSCTQFPLIKDDGEWHVAYVPLNSFLGGTPAGAHPGAVVRRLSIGLNARQPQSTLEVSDLYLLGN